MVKNQNSIDNRFNHKNKPNLIKLTKFSHKMHNNFVLQLSFGGSI